MDMQLKGKLAIVTGGNSGIGYAGAAALAAEGATVIITGRRKEAVEKAAAELGAGVIPFLADQAVLADTDRLVEYVRSSGPGKVDILFINAGITGSGPMEATDERFFDRIIDINFKGAYFTLSKMIPILADGASVVFLSSCVASMNGLHSTVYSSSKAALNAVMKIAALELAPRGIRVNAVSPGPTKTNVLKTAGYDEATLEQINAHLLQKIPLHTMGRAEDVAAMVVHLCTPAAAFITGSDLLMDGGLSL